MGICIDTYDNIYVTDVDNEKPVIMLTAEGELIAKLEIEGTNFMV